MNFQQLTYVLAVHRHKHFGKAAESCHITQATLSGMIKKLEDELEYLLFDRSRYPIQTTENGLQFINIAKTILEGKKQLFELKNASSLALEGELNLGVIPTIANTLLPIILPKLMDENPKLKLNIVEITTDEIVERLLVDKIDLGIVATPLEIDNLEETILYYESMLVYGVQDLQKNYITSEDVKNAKIWLLEEGHCFRKQAMTICNMQKKDTGMLNLNFEGNSFETLLNMTDKFGGYTLLPELYFKYLTEKRQALTKSFQAPIPVREVSIVTARPHTKAFALAYLSNLVKQLVPQHLDFSKNYKNKDLDIIGL